LIVLAALCWTNTGTLFYEFDFYERLMLP